MAQNEMKSQRFKFQGRKHMKRNGEAHVLEPLATCRAHRLRGVMGAVI